MSRPRTRREPVVIDVLTALTGKVVTLQIRNSRADRDRHLTEMLTGQLLGLAERHNGAAGWIGTQIDVVLYDKSTNKLHTVAASRVVAIEATP